MRGKTFDPRHLDVAAFAEKSGQLEDQLPLKALARLVDSAHPEAQPGEQDSVTWQARGELRKPRGQVPQPWLHLSAAGQIDLTCQRCLQAVRVPLALSLSYRFVADEAAAAEADIDAEEDVLAITRSLNLPGLIEDELLLSLPLVPRHERCPQPLTPPPDGAFDELDAAPRANPFEALAALKGRKTPG